MTRILTATTLSLFFAVVPAFVSADPAPNTVLPGGSLPEGMEQNLKELTPALGVLGILIIAGNGGTNSTTSTPSTTN
ncbi:hypothetical protein DFO80_1541 [Rhodobacter sp. 140A]|uniref:Secreted protein n=1 Tax=Paenirhodobacter huangdaonensis TaxID=2501515 RepID=A0A3S3LPI6_9RHOB|nr:hypothetical protein [Sinirhodobacter huangdaonensis]RBP77741.1 hypothetical protein DFO80_1541 [Rhodobacter sp. 140A]RWR47722.1 hypothetical protein EOW66_19220 [Sinirhodobacter huangdaonensis]